MLSADVALPDSGGAGGRNPAIGRELTHDKAACQR